MSDKVETRNVKNNASKKGNKDLLFLKSDGIATIRLNRPGKKNSFTMDMIDQWVEALEK